MGRPRNVGYRTLRLPVVDPGSAADPVRGEYPGSATKPGLTTIIRAPRD
jgi:hypothetical protein